MLLKVLQMSCKTSFAPSLPHSIDFDVIDLSNLQRQILYSLEDVGQPKIKIAKERLESLNHKVEITAHEEALSSANAGGILADYAA